MDYARFMETALEQARAAYAAGEFPVGCILVHEDRVLASGRRTGTTGKRVNEVDHAEMVALRRLAEMESQIDPDKITLFSTLEPCLMCFGAIILSGIKTIVYAVKDVMGGGTNCDLSRLNPLYRQAGISIVPDILHAESAKLLKAYFQNPEHTYWKDSILARHAISFKL
jgi:tRNA(adenine34) deaminase